MFIHPELQSFTSLIYNVKVFFFSFETKTKQIGFDFESSEEESSEDEDEETLEPSVPQTELLSCK